MAEAYICDFTRSPIGRYAGALKDVRAMETLGLKRAIATMCIGVGQGIAALIERA